MLLSTLNNSNRVVGGVTNCTGATLVTLLRDVASGVLVLEELVLGTIVLEASVLRFVLPIVVVPEVTSLGTVVLGMLLRDFELRNPVLGDPDLLPEQ